MIVDFVDPDDDRISVLVIRTNKLIVSWTDLIMDDIINFANAISLIEVFVFNFLTTVSISYQNDNLKV